MDRRFVDHVLSEEIVTRAEMQRLILQARKNKTGLVTELLGEKSVDEEAVADAVASYYERPRVTRTSFAVDATAVKLISGDMAREKTVLPFSLADGGDTVSIAVVDPDLAETVIEMLRSATGNEPQVWIAPHSFLDRQIGHHYFGEALPEEPSAPGASSMGGAEVDGNRTRLVPTQANTPNSGLLVIDDAPNGGDEVPGRPGTNPRGKALGRIKTAKVRAEDVRKPTDEKEELAQALEEFDNFLDNSSNFLGVNSASSMGAADDDADPFSFDDGSDFGGFDLFGQEVGLDESTSVEDKISRQEETIRQLVHELKRQRDIIQAMASILEEKGVLRKRDLKRRARGKS
jgi:hypothetical protein